MADGQFIDNFNEVAQPDDNFFTHLVDERRPADKDDKDRQPRLEPHAKEGDLHLRGKTIDNAKEGVSHEDNEQAWHGKFEHQLNKVLHRLDKTGVQRALREEKERIKKFIDRDKLVGAEEGVDHVKGAIIGVEEHNQHEVEQRADGRGLVLDGGVVRHEAGRSPLVVDDQAGRGDNQKGNRDKKA